MAIDELDAVMIKLLANTGFNASQIAELYQCGEAPIADIIHGRSHRNARSAVLNLTPTGRVTLVNAVNPNEHTTGA